MSQDPIDEIERRAAKFMPAISLILKLAIALLIGYVAFIQAKIFGVDGWQRWAWAIGIGVIGGYLFRMILRVFTFYDISKS